MRTHTRHRALRAFGAIAAGLLAAVIPATAFAVDAPGQAESAPTLVLGGTAAWMLWFAVLAVFGGFSIAVAVNHERDQESGNAWIAFPAAATFALALSSFDMLGALTDHGASTTMAHALLLLIAANALLTQPLQALAVTRSDRKGVSMLVGTLGGITLALSVLGMASAIAWNPAFWFTLTERVWLAAVVGALVWWIAWSVVVAMIGSRANRRTAERRAREQRDADRPIRDERRARRP